MENSQEDEYSCPSFSSYSSNTLAEIAVQVVEESSNDAVQDDDDFEFSLVRQDREVLTDEFSHDGQIGPIFPVFNHDLLRNNGGESSSGSDSKRLNPSIKVPLRKLLFENPDELDNPPSSSSSSEADELDNIPAGSYCVWRPKAADSPSPSRCKKSKSTGSVSRRWNFRDLLRRSNSEGKDSFVFLTPKSREEKSAIEAPKKLAKGRGTGCGGGVRGSAAVPGSPSAHEALYVRNRAIKEGDKKKSYLPYRQDLVGFFVNGNFLGKGLPHF